MNDAVQGWDERAGRGSMVARTARQIAEISLAASDGAYLGSESDMIARLGVSRPTLRQAAKVAESNQLLSVRRGVNGGFFAARPDAQHVIEAPALWLRLQSATLEDMNQASGLILPEAAALAAHCRDPELVDELKKFRSAIAEREKRSETPSETVRWETNLSRLLGRMSGNPVLMLFADIAYAFGLLERDFRFYRGSAERRSTWLGLQRDFCDAVLAGDVDGARSLGIRRNAQIARWLAEDKAEA